MAWWLAIACSEGDPLERAHPRVELTDAVLDFGPVEEGRGAERGFRLVNNGPVASTLGLTLESGGSPDFTLETSSATIAGTQSRSLRVHFRPSGAGVDTAVVVIATEDPDRPELKVTLKGGPIAPDVVVTPNPVDFGPASGPRVTRPIAVRNQGMATLHDLAVALDPAANGDFSLRAPPDRSTLAPGEELELILDYQRSARATAGRLLVDSDDPEERHLEVRLLPDPLRACEDGADNDGDGLLDFPDDPGCTSATDQDETNPSECGPGQTMPCGSSVGDCRPGLRTCTSSTWGPCEGDTGPTAELCDGQDNDCNGRIDEGLSETCSENGCDGVRACVEGGAGTFTACVPIRSALESCDGQDNDCDGEIDEGIIEGCTEGGCTGQRLCIPGGSGQFTSCQVSPTAELCDGLDNDCDGNIDQGLVNLTCGVGACQRSAAACSNGVPGTCSPGAPVSESCNGQDDDCDGLVDQGLGNLTCGVGACFRTVPACSGGAANTCSPGTPTAETCNGQDDDCDGTPDDLVNLTCGVGACFRNVPACSGNAPNTCSPGTPTAEVCNGLDDDCDGTPDDLVNLTCGVGACFRSVPACSGNTPNTCSPGTPTAEICNGLDDDCDGTPDDGACASCGLMSTAADPQEPNNTTGAARPVVPWTANGTFVYEYDLTLPSGDNDWFRFNFPPVQGATSATLTAEILCVSWAGAGCPGAPTVGLEAWYYDAFFTGGQQDGSHNGLSGLALVTSTGGVAQLFDLAQNFRVRAYPSSSVCAGEAVNAHLRVTVEWTP